MLRRRHFSRNLSADIVEGVILAPALYMSRLGEVGDEITDNSLPSVVLMVFDLPGTVGSNLRAPTRPLNSCQHHMSRAGRLCSMQKNL